MTEPPQDQFAVGKITALCDCIVEFGLSYRAKGRRQFCKLQDEGQSLMRAAMSQLNLVGTCMPITVS